MSETTIYTQTKGAEITLYCQECKPKGTSRKGTLVVSGYDHFCNGCGEDFKELAERKEKQEG